MTTPEQVFAALEPVAGRFQRHELTAMWGVVDAYRAGAGDLDELVARALADAEELERYADLSNECGPGFPRDDPGPWYWSCLGSLTKAAALAPRDPVLALHYVACAQREAANITPSRPS